MPITEKKENGRRQGKGGTNQTPHGRSSFFHRWCTLRKYYVHFRLEDVSIIVRAQWKHVGSKYGAF